MGGGSSELISCCVWEVAAPFTLADLIMFNDVLVPLDPRRGQCSLRTK